ncbi:MAG: 4-amino-4-deoxychorismate lyase [Verrucomicrobiales bacterium]|nr:4-amino-4-deoxychorismate lyase [Verrucomicrobiales bacterium]
MQNNPSTDPNGSAGTVFYNGDLIDAREVNISPFDHGLLTGDGIFETLIAYDGEPFATSRHYKRLTKAANTMGLDAPAEDDLVSHMRTVLKANDLEFARLRVTITGGDSPLGSDRGSLGQTLVVAVSTVPEFNPAAKVFTVNFARNDKGALVGLKTISYGENVVALKTAKENGANEAIFGNTEGNLCEGTGTNIFVVYDGQLITPPLTAGCLGGITRGLVIELCGELGVGVEETDTPLADLVNAEEAFLTSTLREVQPICEVNGQAIPVPEDGLAPRLKAAFGELVKRTKNP